MNLGSIPKQGVGVYLNRVNLSVMFAGMQSYATSVQARIDRFLLFPVADLSPASINAKPDVSSFAQRFSNAATEAKVHR